MRKLFLFFYFITSMTGLNAARVYKLNPSVDLPKFIENLQMAEDVEIILRLSEGTYYLNKPLCFTADKRYPIKIEGLGRVIITGTEPIKGWEIWSNGVWRTTKPINYEVHSLNVNGKLATRARTPNFGFCMSEGGALKSRKGENVEYKVILPDNIKNELNKIDLDEKPVINLFRHFTHSKAKIKEFSIKDHTLCFTELYCQSFYTPDKSTGVILENYYAALDSPGEWYQDIKGYLYYYPHLNENINQESICASKINNLVTVSGTQENYVSNVTFKNLIFEGCDVVGGGDSLPPYQSAYTVDASFHATYAKHINILNCEFRCIAGNAIWMMDNCEDCTLSYNYIHDVGAGGIKIGGLYKEQKRASKNIVVKNNVIERFGRVYMGASGIFLIFANNCDISNNDVSDGFYSGISVGFSWGYGYTPTYNNNISFNRVWNIGQGMLNDMAGIYTLGYSPGTIINNNVIWNVKTSKGGGYGIYTDEGSSDILIQNNIAYYCDGGGFHQHYGSRNIVRNNIFAFGDKKNIACSIVMKPEDVQLYFEKNIVIISKGEALSGNAINAGSFIFNDNCFFDVNGGELTVNGNSLDVWMNERNFTYIKDNPRLKSPEKGDFRFKSKHIVKKMGFKPIKVSKTGSKWHPVIKL